MDVSQILILIGIVFAPTLTYLIATRTFRQAKKAEQASETSASKKQNIDEWTSLIETAVARSKAAEETAEKARKDVEAYRLENDDLKKARSQKAERLESLERKVRMMSQRDKEFRSELLVYVERLYRWDSSGRQGPMPRLDDHILEQLRATYPDDEGVLRAM